MTGRGSGSRGRGSRGSRGSRESRGRGSRERESRGRGSRGRGSRGRGSGKDCGDDGILSCCVPYCNSSSNNKTRDSFFKIPTNAWRDIWLQFINRMDLKDSYNNVVCEDHFKQDDIVVFEGRKKLTYSSLPIENLDELNELERTRIDDNNKYTQTNYEEMVSSTISDAHDVNVNARPEYDETVEEEINKLYDICDKHPNKDVAELLKAQISLKVVSSGNINDINYLIFCLNFYYKSPEIYRLLERSLNLPNPKLYNINTFYIKSDSEANQDAMNLFKIKVKNMCPKERQCVLLVDSIDLKLGFFRDENSHRSVGLEDINGVRSSTLAKMAVMVMVRGIYFDWEQPIGFAFLTSLFKTASEIIKLINNQLTTLLNCGLDVRALVLNTDNNLHNLNNPGLSDFNKENFFIHNKKLIYYIYDVHHIYSKLRDAFVKFDIKFKDKIARISDVKDFYNMEKGRFHRLAPELTEDILESTIFSNEVVTGMSRYADLDLLDESVRDTVDIFMMLNKLYEFLNSKEGEENPNSRPLEEAQQKQFLYEMLEFLDNLHFVNRSNGFVIVCPMHFLHSFKKTIQSVLILFHDLKNSGFNYLPTGRLNLAPIENFNSNLCAEFETDKLNAEHFTIGFHKLFFQNILKPPVGKSMKNDDLEEKGNTVFEATEKTDYVEEKQSTEITMFDFCEYINRKCDELSEEKIESLILMKELGPSLIENGN